MSQTFDWFFTGTGAIRRQAIIVAGKRGTSGSSDVTITCTEMTAVTDDEVRRQIKTPILDTPMEARQVFAGSSGYFEVRKGDLFVQGTRAYPIRSVERWPWQLPHEHLVRLIIEVMDK